MFTPSLLFRPAAFFWMACVLALQGAVAQAPEMPPSPVRYTEARQHEVREAVVLPGSVRAPTVSIVASEVSGPVAEIVVREGDAVEKGQLLARLRTTSLELERDSMQAQLREAEARLRQAATHLERARELVEANVISREQFDDRQFEVNAWEARIEQLQADIARIDDDIERSVILSPFAGVVVAKQTEVGQWLNTGDPVAEILSVEELEVHVEVPERYFGSLRRELPVSAQFDSLNGTPVAGRIRAIVPSANAPARTFPIKISIERTTGLGAGMLAQVSLPLGDTSRATIVPKDAIVRRGAQQFVYLVTAEGTASMVPVETGQAVGSWVVTRGEVSPGQRVITRGNERLQHGQPVQGDVQEYPLP